MRIISIEHEGVEVAAAQAAAALRAGGVVVYPTDTLYGIGADALSDEAVAHVIAIKGRDEKKPIHAIVSDVAMAARFCEIDDRVRRFIALLPAGKVTFILKKVSPHRAEHAPYNTGILRDADTFGFRIPDHALCREMCRAFGGPITATSANISGMPTQPLLGAILAQLGAAVSLIDTAIDGGTAASTTSSTVVDCTHGSPRVVRESAVSSVEITSAWKKVR